MRLYQKLTALTALCTALTLPAAAGELEVFTLNSALQPSTVTVPENPQRAAVLDYAVMDIMQGLGLEDRIVASAKGAAPSYLTGLVENEAIVNAGTVKQVSLERLMEAEPEVIFIGGRLASQYDKLSAIAPVVLLSVDYEQGTLASAEHSAKVISQIFDKEDEVSARFAEYKQRLEVIQQQAAGKTAMLGLVTAGGFNVLGDHARLAFITTSAGFKNLAPEVSATHGAESSFELLSKLNPEYIFVLDRDSAIARPGSKLAQEVMDNELVNSTQAAKEGHIIYINAGVWYLAEGGLQAMDYMLSDLERALGIERAAADQ